MKPVVFDSEAKDEFNAAAAYYEKQRVGLGDDFVAEVEQTVNESLGRLKLFPRMVRPEFGKLC